MVSRRKLLKGASALGVSSVVSAASAPTFGQGHQTSKYGDQELSTKELLDQLEAHEVKISSDQMTVGVNTRRGTLTSIVRRKDPLSLNYIGNFRNTPSRLSAESSWMGDVTLTTWQLERDWKSDDTDPNVPFHLSGRWRAESTVPSNDIRKVIVASNSLQVDYQGISGADGGIKGLALRSTFLFDDEGALIWKITIRNVSGDVLEIGELGLPMCFNSDYSEFSDIDSKIVTGTEADSYGAKTRIQQKLIHEQKVVAHHFVGGHSSYSLIQRPLGDPPFLLFHPIEGTALECIYRENTGEARSYSIPEVLAVHSRAVKDLRGWRHNDWVNGHTSVVLLPDEVKEYSFRFTFIPSYDAMRDEQRKAGNLGIRIVPAMVVQESQTVSVEILSDAKITEIQLKSDNISITHEAREGSALIRLRFQGRGTKSLSIRYGAGRWTNLHFYCVEDFERLLKARAQFAVKREFYSNESDPFHRFHLFLPFDYRKGNIILDSDEAWEVGGSDEPGFSTPLFLAEKNVQFPDREEIEALETYVSDCLFKYIQDPDTFTVRASLYWVVRKPSSPWGEWSEARSQATWRTYNYVHPANIYHALYRIGKHYDLLKRRDSGTYLRMAYRTCMKWFDTGPWKSVGLMEGSNVLNILQDLKSEGWTSEYDNLFDAVRKCDAAFVAEPYPYSSELLIDQTAHEQVYFFTRFFGDHEKNAKTVQVLKALRGGNQPVWFHYGNDKRGDICAWYSASLNGLALLQSFEETGDQDALARGYGGVTSVMSNVTADGMGFNYFNCAAGVLDHEPPITWEGGCGLWGFLQAVKSIVVRDSSLGLIGYGCEVHESASAVTIKPRDGLRKRIFLTEQRIAIDLVSGEITSCSVDKSGDQITIIPSDSTGLVKRIGIACSGLSAGDYAIGPERKAVGKDKKLVFEVPFAAGQIITVKRIPVAR